MKISFIDLSKVIALIGFHFQLFKKEHISITYNQGVYIVLYHLLAILPFLK